MLLIVPEGQRCTLVIIGVNCGDFRTTSDHVDNISTIFMLCYSAYHQEYTILHAYKSIIKCDSFSLFVGTQYSNSNAYIHHHFVYIFRL